MWRLAAVLSAMTMLSGCATSYREAKYVLIVSGVTAAAGGTSLALGYRSDDDSIAGDASALHFAGVMLLGMSGLLVIGGVEGLIRFRQGARAPTPATPAVQR